MLLCNYSFLNYILKMHHLLASCSIDLDSIKQRNWEKSGKSSNEAMMSSQMVHSIVMSSLTKKREIRRLHYNLGYWDIKFTKISSSLSLSLSLSFSLTHSLSLTLSLSLSLTHTHTHTLFLSHSWYSCTHPCAHDNKSFWVQFQSTVCLVSFICSKEEKQEKKDKMKHKQKITK
jgi:hypothetical protein